MQANTRTNGQTQATSTSQRVVAIINKAVPPGLTTTPHFPFAFRFSCRLTFPFPRFNIIMFLHAQSESYGLALWARSSQPATELSDKNYKIKLNITKREII